MSVLWREILFQVILEHICKVIIVVAILIYLQFSICTVRDEPFMEKLCLLGDSGEVIRCLEIILILSAACTYQHILVHCLIAVKIIELPLKSIRILNGTVVKILHIGIEICVE